MPSSTGAERRARVLFLDQAGEIGGAQLSLLDLAVSMRERSKVLSFLEGPFPELLRKSEVDVLVADTAAGFVSVPRGAGPLRALRGASKGIALGVHAGKLAREFDIVYANSQKALVVGAIAAHLSRKPLIWHLRDLLNAKEVSATARRVACHLANSSAALVIANSHATQRAFIEVGGRTTTATVYNGIDVGRFGPGAAPPHTNPTFARPGPIVGVFSRLAEWKGQHIAISALSGLRDVNLLLVGGALFGEQPYEHRLREQVRALGLDGRVFFAGARDDVPALMQMCDVIAHTSTSPEPFGRVIVEGMLSRKPVIATNAGGVPEIITNGETGLLVECGDPHALAAAIRRLTDNSSLAQQLGQAGWVHAKRSFSVEAYRDAIQMLVERVRASASGTLRE